VKSRKNFGIIRVTWLISCIVASCLVSGVLLEKAEAAPTVTPSSLPGGQVNVAYYATLSSTTCTGSCQWSVTSGGLPPGLNLSPTGVISGTPTLVGPFSFYVIVTDSTGPSAAQSFNINIAVPPITFTTTSLPDATAGQSYSGNILASGGSGTIITYAMAGGTMPSGLTMSSTGQISGIPARGTAGSYSFTVTATSGTATAQQAFTIAVQKGTFDVTVTISPTLTEGQTKLYINNVPRGNTLRGGDSVKITGLDPDSVVNVSVDNIVQNPSRPDIRYRADASSASASLDVNLINFTYRTEYSIDLRSEPSGITSISGSGWYRDGTPINLTAPNDVPKDNDSQYRFSFWLTPSGDKINSQILNTTVTSPGKYIATYDLYYRVDVESQFGSVQGSGWQKAGGMTKWSVTPAEVPMTGFLGFFGGKVRALLTSGSVTVDGPKVITVQWDPDYTTPIITIPLAIIVIASLIYGIYSLSKRGRRPEPAPYSTGYGMPPPPPPLPPYPMYSMPPPPPPPPMQQMPPPQTTVVMIGDGLKKSPQTTREQLMEKFGELLQKYEDELGQGRELPAAPPEMTEVAPPSEKKSLPSPDIFANAETMIDRTTSPVEECGFTTKKLLRTVVTQWKNTSIKPITITPGDKKSAAMAGGRTVTWTRETFNEWELHVCKLPLAHKGTHKGSTEVCYSLLDTINEERNYGPKQPLKPPSPHFTDGMPELDIAASQIVPSDQLPA
jgi:hypothetical protein